MKRKKKKTENSKSKALKKELKAFLFEEEGKISKKNVVKMGLSLAVLSSLVHPDHTEAGHANSFFGTNRGGHSSHGAHGSHGSHGSHDASF